MLADPVTCDICGHISKSSQSHSVHMCSKHGVKSRFRRYVDGHVCRICLRNFWTRERCLNHVRYRSVICKSNTLMRGPVISNEEADSLDQMDCSEHSRLYALGKRRCNADLPCIQNQGPLLPIITIHSSSHHRLGFGHNYR